MKQVSQMKTIPGDFGESQLDTTIESKAGRTITKGDFKRQEWMDGEEATSTIRAEKMIPGKVPFSKPLPGSIRVRYVNGWVATRLPTESELRKKEASAKRKKEE